MSRDFKQDVKLDQYALDTCALEQPELYAYWGEQWADAVNDRDRCKDRLALVRSACDEAIRKDPRKYGWVSEKAPTEAFIASAINGHDDFKEANDEYLAACHDVNILAVAKESFEQRRKMIEVLAQLYVSSYFSGNKDFDKAYQATLDKSASKAQSDALAGNARMKRRKVE